ncbi:aminotransferase class I/II-fold pyridoxal phosphate-dependent enzyme [Sediminibacterium sp.]|uniref:aminotransferase class I/II-fold pyridoxal phosphate-dependent enzyme n=1 Tax=Sediminibacterium sp. TaxID=1917865 RepID=UPI0027343E77|nr:aminotransferase class I/II-fold pyridoxal phosphate-dependent enzyme [Sediminibacterium sp.]MDP3392424.1 aminotransferase class I/II-fold pyridoxal phosphate-dependent enzyme [Sediminibacterium sp.]MDP3565690.1 aminotransferase class I/II-fold pyridoxal phosphate-dependent enzyme [Sediminibacterium sp.]
MMSNNKIWLSSPHMGGDEKKYVNEAFDTNWVAPLGPNVNGFESDITSYLTGKLEMHAAVLTSGTAALHLALRLLDVGPKDIVIVQSFTFCGTTNPVSYQGAEIVFIDSESDTWNMCPIALEEALKAYQNRSVKAIIPVHLYGMPAKMNEIQAIADKYSIPIIEDAAEALGSLYRGQSCGTFGNMAALSFNGNKIITTSGGGALISTNKKYIDQARFLATQARDEAPHYQHSQIGYNYRMSNIVAGIGRGQMEVIDLRVAQRRANNQKYRDFFKDIPGITFQTEPNDDFYSNFWLTAILIDSKLTSGISRETIRLKLEEENIESRPLWKPMHMQPIYEGTSFFGKGVCENFFENGLCLPSGSNLTEKEFERIFSALTSIFKK